uniref:Uncharacterized protein n=1 Tax=Anguilla anguilla TaxID=7936 RepID=A0A0E9TCG5_ANGAN
MWREISHSILQFRLVYPLELDFPWSSPHTPIYE